VQSGPPSLPTSPTGKIALDNAEEILMGGDDGDDEKADAARRSFAIFSDRSAADLEALEWNPSMDLLACLTAQPDSTLSIYRLLSDNPKILSEKVTGIGTVLAWSPCGRKVAVGDRLGGVTIYDGETGAVLHTKRLHDHPVRALSWEGAGAGAGSEGTNEPPWSQMLPPLLSMPSAPSNMYAELPDADVESNVSSSWSLLASADEGGLVIISAGGTFPLQSTQISVGGTVQPVSPSGSFSADFPRGKQLDTRRLSAVRLSPDLRYLAVLVGAQGSAAPGSSSANSGVRSPLAELSGLSPVVASGLGSPLSADHSTVDATTSADSWPNDEVVTVLDVRKLAVRRHELAQCSRMAERLTSVSTYTRKSVETLGSVWRGAADGFTNKMRGLSEAIEKHADKEPLSIHLELLLTCCMGTPSDAVHIFLTRQTSPQQLARLERTVMQAFEYVNLVVCTRLQVAGNHILTILHELHACAGWTQKYKSIGLEVEPLKRLMAQTQRFLQLTELLLLECSQARRFLRTLFQVLLRMSQKMADQPSAAEPGVSAPTKEDMDDFISRMQQSQSLELLEVTNRISGSVFRTADAASTIIPGHSRWSQNALETQPQSLLESAQGLAAEAEKVGTNMVETLSAHVAVLACIPVNTPSPWASVAIPELKTAASQDFAAGVPSPRGIGGSTLALSWEALDPGLGARLNLLWSGGGSYGAELHICRVNLTPAPPGVTPPINLERARLLATSPPVGNGRPAHFVLCQMYDACNASVLVLEEQGSAAGGAVATVCLVNVSILPFHAVSRIGGCGADDGGSLQLPPPSYLANLPADSMKRSVKLPESYVWSSAMRCMASRGVCSVYARRARRLVTLDMEAEANDDEENDEDAG